jgi:RNA polymerase sigma-70 factor (ECF subfamily)
MLSRLKEQFLLYRVNQEKDPEAFATLYDMYVKQIYQFVFLKVRRKEDAEDLVSQIFLKAWEYLTEDSSSEFLSLNSNFSNKGNSSRRLIRNFRAFIYQLARHFIVDFYRQQARQETLFLDDLTSEFEEKISGQTANHLDLAEQMAFQQEKEQLLKALDKLKEEQKEAIILRYIEGLPIKEVAEILGKSSLATRVLLYRAMRALKKELSLSG